MEGLDDDDSLDDLAYFKNGAEPHSEEDLLDDEVDDGDEPGDVDKSACDGNESDDDMVVRIDDSSTLKLSMALLWEVSFRHIAHRGPPILVTNIVTPFSITETST